MGLSLGSRTSPWWRPRCSSSFKLFRTGPRFGRYMYAVGGDESLAAQAGVDVDMTKIIVFAMAGLFYGLSALFPRGPTG